MTEKQTRRAYRVAHNAICTVQGVTQLLLPFAIAQRKSGRAELCVDQNACVCVPVYLINRQRKRGDNMLS
jgi:hypothetical protein